MKKSVSLNNPVFRFSRNPILTAKDVNKVWTSPALKVMTVHNAGVAEFDGKTVMLFRSHLRSGISIIGLASSKDGKTNWKVQKTPALVPEEGNEDEAGGLEDPRITKIGDEYVILFSAYNSRVKDRVRISLATTRDFKSFKRHGLVAKINMRNIVLFPEKIGGEYKALFRPNDKSVHALGGKFTEIKIGGTKDYKKSKWRMYKKPLIKTGHGPSAISDKIGPGAPPIKTKKGWLNIFHGVRSTMSANPYVLSVALHDLKDPRKVKVSNIPILFPTQADAKVPKNFYRHAEQIVFTCGALRKTGGDIFIYYGGYDTVMNLCVSHEDVLIDLCERYGQDPLSGRPLYKLK